MTFVHKYMYNIRYEETRFGKEIIKTRLVARSSWGNHDIWTNGEIYEPVPRHPEINELLSKKILKKAEKNPGEGKK